MVRQSSSLSPSTSKSCIQHWLQVAYFIYYHWIHHLVHIYYCFWYFIQYVLILHYYRLIHYLIHTDLIHVYYVTINEIWYIYCYHLLHFPFYTIYYTFNYLIYYNSQFGNIFYHFFHHSSYKWCFSFIPFITRATWRCKSPSHQISCWGQTGKHKLSLFPSGLLLLLAATCFHKEKVLPLLQ